MAESISILEKNVQYFVKSIVSLALYIILAVTVIGILGIPMASIAAVLASCGLAENGNDDPEECTAVRLVNEEKNRLNIAERKQAGV